MWSDNETVEDLIGFRVHAELIASVVTDKKLLPLTMGVFGDWGNGKTSIMKMLQAELAKQDDIAVLYFDAWLFEGYDDAKSALISSIVRQMSEHKRFPAALKDQAKSLIRKVNWMRVLKMGWDNVALPAVLAYATGGATAVPGLIGGLKGLFSGPKQSWQAADLAEPLKADSVSEFIAGEGELEITAVRDFRDEFADLLAKTTFKSLVVLIDDLDRCSPERIVENLEAIKLFLNVGSTAFVIGADPRIVKHAIAVRYRDSLDAARAASSPGENANEAGEQLVRDYVEKLIQIPYHLPRLSPTEIETYLCLLFSQRDLTPDGFNACLAACNARRAANRFGTFGLADIQVALGTVPVPETLRLALTFTAGAAQLITENLKGNPRQVKRFLNAFVLRKKLASVARMTSLRDDVLLKLMLLEYSNEVRFRELARWHEEQNATPRELRNIETNKSLPNEWEKPSLERWAKMEPLLADVDLSEYFWLVRDKLASSLGGMSLVAPIVRTAYAGLLTESGRKRAPVLLKDLRADEVDSLLLLLTRHVQREPTNSEGYSAFLTCAETHPRSLTAFEVLLRQIPESTIPAFLPTRLEILVRNPNTAGLAKQLLDLIKSFKQGTAGKAARTERKRI